MKKIPAIIVCMLLLLLNSCITVPVVTLDSVKTDTNEISIDRGNVTQTITQKDQMIAMTSTALDGKEAGIIVGIGNASSNKHTFLDSDIEIYGGNIDTDQWKSIGTWDANKYYNKSKNAAATSEFWTTFGGAMMSASTLMGSTSTSNVNTQYGNYTVTTRTYDPAQTALTGMIAADMINNEKIANKTNLDWLKANLLYSSEILPRNIYTGVFFFNASKYPDYMIKFKGNSEDMNFFFQRSDRNTIINPWLDQSRIRHSIALNYGFHNNNIGLLYFMSQPKGVGVYTGLTYADLTHTNLRSMSSAEKFSYYSITLNENIAHEICQKHNITSEYSIRNIEFTSTGNILVNSLNIPIGMTIKVFPNSWLLLGAEIRFGIDKIESGNFSYSIDRKPETYNYPEEIYLRYTSIADRSGSIAMQIGFNFISNMIDFYVLPSYDFFSNKLGCDIGIGYAF